MCYIANPRSAAICDEHCSLHGGVCDNGVCEFRCSDYAGYTCQNSSSLLPSLSLCGDVLVRDVFGQHCAPSEPSILQQLEAAVVVPNYNRLMPGGRSLFSIFDNSYCSTAAKRLACWIFRFHFDHAFSIYDVFQSNVAIRTETTDFGCATQHASLTMGRAEWHLTAQIRLYSAARKTRASALALARQYPGGFGALGISMLRDE
ncbi:hypothetical protein ZIOFF_046409 [Zingiber officinale]|uniref:EGF-like domain-containing protein n=1 Tax=Zingiber officinale TaxID=94328 RepID=A0A8J5G109_ZINOF|nr:hypothetical protein ZIOFF_046409 [Zingiber officinale]